jgi:hypothetical protein
MTKVTDSDSEVNEPIQPIGPSGLIRAVPALGDQTFKAELVRLAVPRPPFSGSG